MSKKTIHFSEFDDEKSQLYKNFVKASHQSNPSEKNGSQKNAVSPEELTQEMHHLKLQDKKRHRKRKGKLAESIVPSTIDEIFHGSVLSLTEAKKLLKEIPNGNRKMVLKLYEKDVPLSSGTAHVVGTDTIIQKSTRKDDGRRQSTAQDISETIEQTPKKNSRRQSTAQDMSEDTIEQTPKKNSKRHELKSGTPRQGKEYTPKSTRKPFYGPHWSLDDIEKGIESGLVRTGVLRISKRNRSDGYIRFTSSTDDPNDNEDWFVPGMVNMNRALDGDVVYVVPLEGEELDQECKRVETKRKAKALDNKQRQERVNITEKSDDEKEEEYIEDRILAKVVKVKSSTTWSIQHPGFFSIQKPGVEVENAPPIDECTSIRFKPCDKRVPFIMVPTQKIPSEILKKYETFPETIYTVQMDRWRADSLFPRGTYAGHLGQIGELHTESQALLISNGILWEEFSEEIIESLNYSITETDFLGRRDLRNECIFSIDPPTARDLDDALSCTLLEDGNYEVGVHIADVSHFVKPNTPLDDEAYNRATSVYLVQKVIPMLPRLLCEELCSLNPDVDRLSFSVFWKMTPQAEVIGKPEFCKSVIRSCAKLWYDHAQAVIEGRDWNEVSDIQISNGFSAEYVQNQIKTLYNLSQVLRKKRYDNGALSLHSIKLWFSLDDQGNPSDTGMYQIRDANRLVEEFMLLANMAVSERLATTFGDAALLRRHASPNPKALKGTLEVLQKQGIVLDVSSSKALNDSFDAIEDPIKNLVTRLQVIKSMKRAEYFCTASMDISEYFHYGLCVPLYTHFTSPIRRYCDLIVHRMLEATLLGEENMYTKDQVQAFAEQCNLRKNASKDAQDASQRLYLCTFLSILEKEGKVVCEAHVAKVGSRSVDVVVPRFGMESRVYVEDSMELGDALGCDADEEKGELHVHWKTKVQTIKAFDSIQVYCVSEMTSPPRYKLFLVPQ